MNFFYFSDGDWPPSWICEIAKFYMLRESGGPRHVSCHHSKFRQNQSVCCRDIAVFFILKVVAVRHLGFVWSIFGLPTVIFNTEQNLIVIDAVFLIIWILQYLTHSAEKWLFSSHPKIWFWGYFPPKWATVVTPLHEFTIFEPSIVKIQEVVWPVGKLLKRV